MKVVKIIRQGAVLLEIKRYGDGRYGFDYKPPDAERVKIRKRHQVDAETEGMKRIGATQAGKVQLLDIDPKEYAEFLAWKASKQKLNSAPAVIRAYLETRKGHSAAGEITPQHYEDLERILNDFKDAFSTPFEQITRGDAEKWLNEQKVGPKRWNSMRAAIVSCIRHARVDRLVAAEITPIEQIPKRKTSTIIGTFTADELKRILRVVDSEWLPAVVFGAFCGVRPEEMCPDIKNPKPALAWENILWSRQKIDVPKRVSKTGKRRFVPICAAAMSFLGDFRNATGPVVPRKALSNEIRKWVRRSGVKWKDDVLRHSYASYRLAETQDIQALSLEMGNSPKIIHDHYLELKHEDEATEWFAIRAKDVRQETKKQETK